MDPTTTPISDPTALAQTLWSFIVTKDYAAAMGPGVALAVWALRKYDLKIPKIGPAIDKFLNIPFVMYLLPSVVSGLAAVLTAAVGHEPLKAAVLPALQAAMSAVFTYTGLKNLAATPQHIAINKAIAAAAPTPPARPRAMAAAGVAVAVAPFGTFDPDKTPTEPTTEVTATPHAEQEELHKP